MRVDRRHPVILLSLSLLCLAYPFLPPAARAADAPPPLWEVSFDSRPDAGGNGYEVMHDVVPTADGGAVAGGYAIPSGYAIGGTPKQGFLVRLDAFGAEVWRTFLGDLAGEGYEIRRIRRTGDGGFVVSCVAWTPFGPDSAGNMYYNTSFVAKLDGNGIEQWRYPFDPLLLDEVGDVDVLSDGSVVAAGRAWTPGGGTITAVAKISPTGSLQWLRKELPDYIQDIGKIAATPDGGFFATSGSGVALTLSRYASNGRHLWSVGLRGLDGETYASEKSVHGITVLADGGCVVAGATRYTYAGSYGPFCPFLATFDARGRQTDTLVAHTVSNWVHAVERLADGGLVAVEGVEGSDAGLVFVRYDRTGNESWRTDFGVAPAERYIDAVRVTGEGGLVAAGGIRGAGSLDPLDGYVLMTGAMASPCAAVKIDVLPGSRENPVNYRAQGLLPVALLSSADFDATRVNPATVALEGAPAHRIGRGRLHETRKDVNGDGRPDLLLFFSIPSLHLSPETTRVTMTGTAPDGSTFSATDKIRVVGRPHGGQCRD